jgi:hypothetical protein
MYQCIDKRRYVVKSIALRCAAARGQTQGQG